MLSPPQLLGKEEEKEKGVECQGVNCGVGREGGNQSKDDREEKEEWRGAGGGEGRETRRGVQLGYIFMYIYSKSLDCMYIHAKFRSALIKQFESVSQSSDIHDHDHRIL